MSSHKLQADRKVSIEPNIIYLTANPTSQQGIPASLLAGCTGEQHIARLALNSTDRSPSLLIRKTFHSANAKDSITEIATEDHHKP